jgi:hypothetical protein
VYCPGADLLWVGVVSQPSTGKRGFWEFLGWAIQIAFWRNAVLFGKSCVWTKKKNGASVCDMICSRTRHLVFVEQKNTTSRDWTEPGFFFLKKKENWTRRSGRARFVKAKWTKRVVAFWAGCYAQFSSSAHGLIQSPTVLPGLKLTLSPKRAWTILIGSAKAHEFMNATLSRWGEL